MNPGSAASATTAAGIVLRALETPDLPQLIEVLRRVYEHDGYPSIFPADPAAWIASGRPRESWVASGDEGVVGHVSRAVAEGDPALEIWCRHTGLPPSKLAVVKRLLVDPRVQRRGVGRALLDLAVAESHRLGLRPVLDVDVESARARRLYERAGFDFAGEATMHLSNGGVFVAACLVGPPPADPGTALAR